MRFILCAISPYCDALNDIIADVRFRIATAFTQHSAYGDAAVVRTAVALSAVPICLLFCRILPFLDLRTITSRLRYDACCRPPPIHA